MMQRNVNDMEIINVVPHGYCAGVIRAIRIAVETAKNHPGEKITMLGMIVHNQFVVDECIRLGIGFVENPRKTREQLLDEIDEGIVIFTAHGISDSVRRKAIEKGLTVVDASCQDVIRTHTLVREHVKHGDVLYIGKKNHPESEGTVSLSDRVHLITSSEDLSSLPALSNVLITCQTTLSLRDTEEIIKAAKAIYPDAVVAEEICTATRMRQEAVMNLKDTDCLIVVGDPKSNNSNQLKKIASNAGIRESYLIGSVMDLKEEMIQNKNRIAVTSGSSTPNSLTNQVIEFLKQYADSGVWQLPDEPSIRLL